MAQAIDKSRKIYVAHIDIRQSIFFMLLKLILLDVIAAFLSVAYFLLVSNRFTFDLFGNSMPLYNLLFFLTLVILKISFSIYVVMKWINEYYEVWPDSIIHKSGFLIKNEEKHPLSHIRSIKVERGFLGKAFGYGTITVYDWFLMKHTSLYLIHNPIKYCHIIESLLPRTEEEKQIFQESEE